MILGFKDIGVPYGIQEIIDTHLAEYDYIKNKENQKTKKEIQAEIKAKVKKMLYSFYAQQKLKFVPRSLIIKVSDSKYRDATKAAKDAYEHFKSCIETGLYADYTDANLSIMLNSQFRDYLKKLQDAPKFTKAKLLKCCKTAIILQLVNAEGMEKSEAVERANAALDGELEPSQSVKFTKSVEYLEGYTADLICFI